MPDSTVASVMTTDLVGATRHTPYADLVRLLAEHRIGAVPVVDDDGALIGVVSEVDLSRASDEPCPPTAGELMTRPVRTISPGAGLDRAARQLAESGVRRLYVVDGLGRPCGVLSRGDLLGSVPGRRR